MRITMGVVMYKSTMMKGMITSSAKAEGTAFWDAWLLAHITEQNHVFKEKKKPKPPSSIKSKDNLAGALGTEDYTTEKELKALFNNHTLADKHEVKLEVLLGLSCEDFFKDFVGDDAAHSLAKFYDSRGEQKIDTQPWKEAATDEEKVYDGKTIKEVREMNVEF